MTEEQLSALLRLKRHELPPPGYFDELLRDVHRRQREELLQRPLWKIAMERWRTSFSEHSMGPVSYGGAFAALMLTGVVAIHSVSPEPAGSSSRAVSQAPARAEAPQYALRLQPGSEAESLLVEQRPVSGPSQFTQTPRYVIDARPVSYEPLFSF